MIYQALSSFAESLSGHLSRVFSLHDDMVALAPYESRNATSLPNKIVVTLVNIERETAGGITFSNRPSGERFAKLPPTWQVNLYVLVAAVFAEKQYGEGLQFLSESMCYIRNHPTIDIMQSGESLAVEPVNLSMAELSNLWSISGGTYRPSILCKIRLLDISGAEIRGTAIPITQKETKL